MNNEQRKQAVKQFSAEQCCKVKISDGDLRIFIGVQVRALVEMLPAVQELIKNYSAADYPVEEVFIGSCTNCYGNPEAILDLFEFLEYDEDFACHREKSS